MPDSNPFTPQDLAQLDERGIGVADAAAQLEYLRTPPRAIALERPCSVGDGISRIEAEERRALIDRGDAAAAAGRVTKFVPASGAATRMFKDLIAALQDPRRPSASPAARELFETLDAYPFAEELRRLAKVPGRPRTEHEERTLLETLLVRMRYAQLPKALIPFHRTDRRRTAFEEQLLEGARYVRAADGICRMHFTVAPEFRGEFVQTLCEIRPGVERRRRGSRLDVGFSEQQPSTDTLAIDADGQPFRLEDGSLLFRPGGHGALIANLHALGGDIVSIKNVDNILPDETTAEVVRWKRILIGYLAQVQGEVFEMLAACEPDDAPEPALDRAIAFAAFRFSRRPAREPGSRAEKRQFVFEALDRPLRVCGVVRNEGEPGGAPFWVAQPDGTQSVQIVESSQVNAKDPAQVRIFRSATHFNPVDIVCGLRSWRGERFDLRRYVDPTAVFASKKTHEGRELTALERPGLWNGAMAGWNTVCVEVPASTFAPVKTVFDLLRPQHQYRATGTRAAAEPAGPGGRVLVIVHDPENQRALRRLLEADGYEVSVAAEGERGLEIARAGQADLVLLDPVLPGQDGYEVRERLRQSPETRDLPAEFIETPLDAARLLPVVRLQTRLRQLSRAVEQLKEELVDKQETLAQDLRAAADIQKALLPSVRVETREITSGSLFQPSLEVGGDIFNVVPVNDREMAAYAVDVSGHGVASALLAASVTQRLSAPFGLLRDGAGQRSPAGILRQLESEYPHERFGKYFSLVLVLIDVTTGRFRYSSAGHPPPLVVQRSGEVEYLGAGGPVIGMGFGLPFDEGNGRLDAGDRLVLYTNGITDDEGATGERFGRQALERFFVEHAAEPLPDLCAALLDALTARRGDVLPADDLALIALERR